MSISDGGPGAAPVTETVAAETVAAEPTAPPAETNPAEAPPAETSAAEAVAETVAETKVAMQFTAAFWRYTVQLNRAGREDGDAIHVPGKLVVQTPGGDDRTWPAEVTIVKKDPKLRLDLRLSPDRATITVPLEEFALARLTEKLKEFISGYGMTLQIGLAAEDHDGRQILEAVDFSFSSEKSDG